MGDDHIGVEFFQDPNQLTDYVLFVFCKRVELILRSDQGILVPQKRYARSPQRSRCAF
jgi:hypothetical protein